MFCTRFGSHMLDGSHRGLYLCGPMCIRIQKKSHKNGVFENDGNEPNIRTTNKYRTYTYGLPHIGWSRVGPVVCRTRQSSMAKAFLCILWSYVCMYA